jgi:hypothetical protein
MTQRKINNTKCCFFERSFLKNASGKNEKRENINQQHLEGKGGLTADTTAISNIPRASG